MPIKSAPITLVVVVLGIIFSGVATPVEAAGIGTFGAFIVAAIHRKLDWPTVREACTTTLKASAMVIWIMFGATIFVGLYVLEGGQQFVQDALAATGLGPWGILILMQILLVILGMFLDWVGVALLTMPIFVPIVTELGYSPIWFGVVMVIVLEMGLISPPVGVNVFVVKSIAEDVPMSQIFAGIIPFWIAMGVCMAIIVAFPEIALFLPNTMFD